MEESARPIPPRKQKGQAIGPRTLAGEILDVTGAANTYGGSPKMWRGRVARRLVPFRRWGGRVIFLRSELDAFFMQSLKGCLLEEAVVNDEIRRGA